MTIAVVGEALVDLIMDRDGAYRAHLGGSPYNVAIGLARQGVATAYASPLSSDRFGDEFATALAEAGVATPLTRRSPRPTSLALVTIGADGQPAYRLYREGIADKDVSFAEIDAALPERLTAFHTGSLAITPSQLPKIRQLLTRMRERGVATSIDINIRRHASADHARYIDGVRSLLPLADIVKASDEDLAALGLTTPPRQAAETAYAEMDGGLLVLTEGGAGARLLAGERRIDRPAFPVARVGDTVGAGDTFHAALLAALQRAGAFDASLATLSEAILADALTYASAAAALNVARTGCQPPTQVEVAAAMRAGTA